MDDSIRDPADRIAGIAENTMRAHTIAEGAATTCRALAQWLPNAPVVCLLYTHHQSALHLCLGRAVGRSTLEAVLRRFRDLGGADLPITHLHVQQDIRSEIIPGWQTDRAQVTPIRTHDRVRGLLLAGRGQHDPAQLLEECATRIAPVLLGLDRLLYESRLDPVSGLFNRMFLNEALAREYALAQRHAHPLALLLIDVDQFKHLNDTHGHPAGDEALHHIGVALREALRASDIACRYGGDEFAVLLPHIQLDEAHRVAARVHDGIGQCRLHVGEHRLGLSVSIGVAAYDPSTASAQTSSLLAQADQALYRAKAERDARRDE